MALLLAAVTRDVQRLHGVTEEQEARTIIALLLGMEPDEVRSAHDTHARDDFWVEIPSAAFDARPEYVSYGMVDVAIQGVGRMTARVEEE